MGTRRTSRVWAAGMTAAVLVLTLTACEDDDQPTDEMAGGAQAGPTPAPSSGEPADEAPDEASDETPDDSVEGALAIESCFPGDWQVDETSDAWQVPAGDADEVTGTFSVTFSADGSFQMDYQHWYFTEVYLAAPSGDSYVETTWDGTLLGEYTVDEGGAATVEITDSSVTVDQVQVMFGNVVEEDSGTTPIDKEPIPLIYTCEGDRLLGFPVIEPDRSEPWVAYDRAKGS